MAIVINGSGTVTGISVGGLPDDIVDAGTLADNAVGLAQMASGTDGNIITYDTSGNPAVVATGDSGEVLTSSGAGAAPTMAAVSGGKVLQVVSSNLTTQMTSSSTSYVDTGLTATITPSATSSKVLVLCNVCFTYSGDSNGYLILLRDTTEINSGSGGTVDAWAGLNSNATSFAYSAPQQGCNYLDSPSTTSATVYKVQAKSQSPSYSFGINRRVLDTYFGIASNITLMEIAG